MGTELDVQAALPHLQSVGQVLLLQHGGGLLSRRLLLVRRGAVLPDGDGRVRGARGQQPLARAADSQRPHLQKSGRAGQLRWRCTCRTVGTHDRCTQTSWILYLLAVP